MQVNNKRQNKYNTTHHYIYLVTNLINNKKYIGKRTCHCEILDDKYLGSGKIISQSIKKYGKENFSKQILEVCHDKSACNEREKYWISYYNAVEDKNFYNIAKGGDGGDTYSGLSNEELYRIKQIKSNKTIGVNNPMYGTTWSNERRAKIMKSLQEYYKRTNKYPSSGKFGKDNKLSQKILCVETQVVYDGIRDASRRTSIPYPNIIRALKSNGKYTAGKNTNGIRLHWTYYTKEGDI